MRKGGPRLYAWAVYVSDFEACWAVAYFKKESVARSYASRYKRKSRPPHFEQSVTVGRIEIF